MTLPVESFLAFPFPEFSKPLKEDARNKRGDSTHEESKVGGVGIHLLWHWLSTKES